MIGQNQTEPRPICCLFDSNSKHSKIWGAVIGCFTTNQEMTLCEWSAMIRGYHTERHHYSGMLAQWLAPSPHSKKVLGAIPGRGRTFLCGVCMFSPCLCGFSLGAPVSPTVKICTWGLSPVSTLVQGIGLDSGVGPRVLCCGCPLLLRDGLNAENKFHCTLCTCDQ